MTSPADTATDAGVAVPSPVHAKQGSRRLRRRLPRWAPGWLAVAAVLLVAEALSRTEVIPSSYFPPMSSTFKRLVQEAGKPDFWSNIGDTMQGWGTGLALAVAIAVPLGIAIGTFWPLFRALRPVVEFLRPVPSVALIPLAVLLYGSGMETKVFLVTYAAVWPLLLQVLYGVRDIDPVALDTARSFRVRRRDKMLRIVLPSVLPYLTTGLRISSSVALVLAVTAEIVVGAPGVGKTITEAQAGGNVTLMYALIIVTGLLGWTLNGAFRRIEARLLHWHPSQRMTGGFR